MAPTNPTVPLVSRRTETAGFEVRIYGRHQPFPRLIVEDNGEQIIGWRGRTARTLVERPPLSQRLRAASTGRITKSELQSLTLCAAAIDFRRQPKDGLDGDDARVQASERLWQRLRALGCRIPSFHTRVAQFLFRYPRTHFAAADAVCLLALEFPAVPPERLRIVVNDLSRWCVVQRIEAAGEVFFDTDTSPHLHIYRKRTRELTDAPNTGVLLID